MEADVDIVYDTYYNKLVMQWLVLCCANAFLLKYLFTHGHPMNLAIIINFLLTYHWFYDKNKIYSWDE